MTRAIQIEDDTPDAVVSLRSLLLQKDKMELVALLEEATAKEVAATRLVFRLMQRVATAEDAGKRIEATWVKRAAQLEEDTLQLALGGEATAGDFLYAFTEGCLSALVARPGKSRSALAHFLADVVMQAVEKVSADPSAGEEGGMEDILSNLVFSLCQMSNLRPKQGSKALDWHRHGKGLFSQDG